MTKLLDGIVLSDFIEILLGPVDDHAPCPDYIAKKIHTADADRIYVHVEFPNKDNELQKPRVWRIAAWNVHYPQWCKSKELSAKERSVAVLSTELRYLVARKLSSMNGLPIDDNMKTAYAVIKARSPEVIMEVFKISIADLTAADGELKEFKERIGKK